MDYDALVKDAVTALRMLPPEMLQVIPPVVLQHKAALETSLPAMVEMLKVHVMTAIMEGGMGILDKGELERALMLALVQAGVDVPMSESAPLAGQTEALPEKSRPPGW